MLTKTQLQIYRDAGALMDRLGSCNGGYENEAYEGLKRLSE